MSMTDYGMMAIRNWLIKPIERIRLCFADAWIESDLQSEVDAMPPSNLSHIATLRAHSDEPRIQP